jgi:hypothetical protein
VRDDSGEARVVEKVHAANGHVYKTYRSGFTDTDGGTALSPRGPLHHAPEERSSTARAWDRAGNVSVVSCARLRQR